LSTCSRCGYFNPDNANLCQQCGSLLIPPLCEQVSGTPVDVETPAKRGLTGTQNEAIIAGVVFLIVIVIGVFALMSYNPSPTAPAPRSPSWHSVSTYSGSGYDSSGMVIATGTNTITSSFAITGSLFRLDWSYSAFDPYQQTFAVYLYPNQTPIICETSDYTTASHGCNYTTNSSNSGMQNVNQGPGSFSLQVIGTLDHWSITVEDYY
jgi:hypothetical protein